MKETHIFHSNKTKMQINNSDVTCQQSYQPQDFCDQNKHSIFNPIESLNHPSAIKYLKSVKKLPSLGEVGCSVSESKEEWKSCPYKIDDDTTVYLAVVNDCGKFVRKICIDDLINSRERRRDKFSHWKTSSPQSCHNQKNQEYLVALSTDGVVICGLKSTKGTVLIHY